MDEWASPALEIQDVALRQLVDGLAGPGRHMVSAVYFGSATLTEASAGIGVSRATGRRILDEALELLGEWLAGVSVPPAEEPYDSVPLEERPFCTYVLAGVGTCLQHVKADGLCSFHVFQSETGIVPEPGWHERLVRGGRNLYDHHTETELEALVNGRYRGDGRRIDQFVNGMDPLGFSPPRKDQL